jgi:hypothetical protein
MLPPEQFIAMLNKRYPTLWQDLDACRAKYGKTWPGWCFVRRDELADIMESYLPKPANDDVRMRDLTRVKLATILAPWRVSKNVYRFDPDIYHDLIKTSLKGNFPVDLLFRLPEWAVYIETPDLETSFGKYQGFVASLNYSPRTDGEVMLSLVSLDDDQFFIEWLYVKEGITVEQSLARSLERYHTMIKGMKLSRPEEEFSLKEVTAHVSKLLNLILFICQVNSEYYDVRSADGSDRAPRNPLPTKTKKGLRFFAPDKPTVWECGIRLGADLRRGRAEQEELERSEGGTRRSPILHTRVAHWQSYIIGKGSRKDPSKGIRVFKWIHTIIVNARKRRTPEVPVERGVSGSDRKREGKKKEDDHS